MINLCRTFGVHETEQAASMILERYNECGDRVADITMFADDRCVLIGFSELIASEFLVPHLGEPNQAGQTLRGCWYVSDRFFRRIEKVHPEAITWTGEPWYQQHKLLSQYMDLMNKYGVDSCEEECFLLEHADDEDLSRLCRMSKRLKKDLMQ